MTNCPKCRYQWPPHQAAASACPRCGCELSTDDWTANVAIARLTNLAEIGFFADTLEGDGIATNVVQHDEFSALDGSWHSIYILQVPRRDAAAATQRLKDELAALEGQQSWDAPEEDGSQRAAAAGSIWKPVVLVLVASGMAYFAGRSGFQQPPRFVPAKDSLSQALGETTVPLATERVAGRHWRQLRYDEPTRSIVLEEDFDGDGQFDRLRQFRDGHLVADFAH